MKEKNTKGLKEGQEEERATERLLNTLFNPESTAIVGASRSPGKFGYNIVQNLINLGFQGKIFPVNPKTDEILGLKCYPSVASIPSTVDVVVMALPSPLVPEAMEECLNKEVRAVVIISSGFNDAGDWGRPLQNRVMELARRGNIRVVGPNTTGLLNPYSGFTSTFVPLESVRKGHIAFIAQTGMFAGMMLEWIISSQEFGLSTVAGLGNKCDLADHDLLPYFAKDPETRVIMIHMEGIKDGPKFLRAAREATRHKPIIVLKTARSQEGKRAALSHTGSLSGSDELMDSVLKQAGVLRVHDLEELVDYAKIFSYQPLPKGPGTAIISPSGGAGVMAADACKRFGLKLAELNPESIKMIKSLMPEWANPGHPLDIEPLTETKGVEGAFQIALDVVLRDESVDSCMVVIGTVFQPDRGVKALLEVRKNFPGKPLSLCVIGHKNQYEALFRILEREELPVYQSPDRAMRALSALWRYSAYRKGIDNALFNKETRNTGK